MKCYCGGVQDDDHWCEYGDPWSGWSSTPLQRVRLVPVGPDEDVDW